MGTLDPNGNIIYNNVFRRYIGEKMMELKSIKCLGIIHKNLHSKFAEVLQINHEENSTLCLFCDYSNFDIEIGYEFTKITTSDNPTVFSSRIELIKVSQQWSLPFEYIPRGHWTICKFKFHERFPESVLRLPTTQHFPYHPYLVTFIS